MKKTMFSIGIAMALLTACQNNSNQPANQNDGAVTKQDTAANLKTEKHESEDNEEEAERAGKLVLNNGNKWKANAETTEGIKKMMSLVNEYLKKGDTDSKKLGESLEKEFTTVLQKCTMTGEAHEQLHNFLLPLKAKIDKLKETNNVEFVNEIQTYLNNYNNYFE
jgi:hypothetical protein